MPILSHIEETRYNDDDDGSWWFGEHTKEMELSSSYRYEKKGKKKKTGIP